MNDIDKQIPKKDISLYVMNKRIFSSMHGDWINPQKMVFMFSGQLSEWYTISENLAQSINPGELYFFFDRPGYLDTKDLRIPFYLEAIPEFNRQLREIALEAVENLPQEIINLSHSWGGSYLLSEIFLDLQGQNIQLDSVFENIVYRKFDKMSYFWIFVDPFFATKTFCTEGFWIYGYMAWPFFNLMYYVSRIIKKLNKTSFSATLFKRYCKSVLLVVGDICQGFARIINPVWYLNFFEMIDAFSLYREYDFNSFLRKFSHSLKLHIFPFDSSDPKYANILIFTKGFATFPGKVAEMQKIANLSIYRKSFLLFSGYHNSLNKDPNGYKILREMLDFSYQNRGVKDI